MEWTEAYLYYIDVTVAVHILPPYYGKEYSQAPDIVLRWMFCIYVA